LAFPIEMRGACYEDSIECDSVRHGMQSLGSAKPKSHLTTYLGLLTPQYRAKPGPVIR
jgi:hypothetical protein